MCSGDIRKRSQILTGHGHEISLFFQGMEDQIKKKKQGRKCLAARSRLLVGC